MATANDKNFSDARWQAQGPTGTYNIVKSSIMPKTPMISVSMSNASSQNYPPPSPIRNATSEYFIIQRFSLKVFSILSDHGNFRNIPPDICWCQKKKAERVLMVVTAGQHASLSTYIHSVQVYTSLAWLVKSRAKSWRTILKGQLLHQHKTTNQVLKEEKDGKTTANI